MVYFIFIKITVYNIPNILRRHLLMFFNLILENVINMLFATIFLQCTIQHYFSDPSFKFTYKSELMNKFKDFQKTFLQNLFRFFTTHGIPKTDDKHFWSK